MKQLFLFLNQFERYAMVPARLALGWVFIAHGGQKLFGWWGGHGLQGFAGSLETMGLKPALFWAILVSASEFCGGLMVLIGFHARLGAILITSVMVVAIWKVHLPNGFFLPHGYEYNIALLGLALCIALKGSGHLSIRED